MCRMEICCCSDPKISMPEPVLKIRVESHRHATSGAVAQHAHSYPSLIVVTSGFGGLRMGGQNFTLSPDSALIVPEGVLHETYDQPGQPMNIFSVGFSLNNLQISSDCWNKLLGWNQVLALPIYESKKIHQLLRNLLVEQSQKNLDYENVMSASLSRLLIILARTLDKQILLGEAGYDSLSKVREVILGIQNHCHEQNSLVDVAKMAHLSQRQFSNLCHQITGMSYVAYVNKNRCERAMMLLLETKMPVSAIAFEVGFEELSTFYRAFKKMFDKAPREFR